MKFSFPLFALFALAFAVSGCNTLANRRSLYAPKKGEGYWTRTLQEGSWKDRGVKPADTTVKRGAAPATAPAPIPPPPPAPLPAV